jgi:glutamate N-acetyltransferase/amino-acid N-acetyltransferase
METYRNQEEYLFALSQRAQLPEGFAGAVYPFMFTPAEKAGKEYKMNLSLILLDRPTERFAAMFTSNAFPGHPVTIGKKRLSAKAWRAILVNNKISNVRAPGGEEDAEEVLSELGKLIGAPTDSLLPSSTGIIGWKLPKADMIKNLKPLTGQIGTADALGLALGIMTTDSFPKLRRADLEGGSIVAIAKGAGMIEPNLATMLVFIMTDLDVDKAVMTEALKAAVSESFNRISIDSDQSTSDSVFLLSSARKKCRDLKAFEKALKTVCTALAEDIVRNGEGTEHVMKVRVEGASDAKIAQSTAKAVINSPLVKTAIFGDDPNVGRLLSSVGDHLGNLGIFPDASKVEITLGGHVVFQKGCFCLDPKKEAELNSYLNAARLNPEFKGYPQHDRTVDIVIGLGMGSAEASAMGSDLGYDYVKENAEYRS